MRDGQDEQALQSYDTAAKHLLKVSQGYDEYLRRMVMVQYLFILFSADNVNRELYLFAEK